MEDVLKYLREKLDLDYEVEHAKCVEGAVRSMQQLRSYEPAVDFEYKVLEGGDGVGGDLIVGKQGVVDNNDKDAVSGSGVEVNTKDLQNADKTCMQNYGRPYGADGKPTGHYYAFARDVEAYAQARWWEEV